MPLVCRSPPVNSESQVMYEDTENKQAYYNSLNIVAINDNTKRKKKRNLIIGSIITVLIMIIAISIAVPLTMKHHTTTSLVEESKKKEPKTTKPSNLTKKLKNEAGSLGEQPVLFSNIVLQNRLVIPPSNQGLFTEPPYARKLSPFSNITRLKVFTPADNVKRVFVMGDVHGCLKEMNLLLDHIQFEPGSDMLVLAGDLVFKGKDSLGVIRRAKELGALCVRGNHDDKVIRLKTYINEYGLGTMKNGSNILPEGKVRDPIRFGNKHLNIAKDISQDEFNYLVECPLILDIPSIKARIVHGGIDPNIADVVNNDPWSVMNMRNMDENEHPTNVKIIEKEGTDYSLYNHWTTIYNSKPPRDDMTVYYGHDASKGFKIGKRTVGLDSGCVHGRKLSTVEIKSGQLFQVDCSDLYYSEQID